MSRIFTSLLVVVALAGCMPKKVRSLEEDVAMRDATINQLQVQNTGYSIQVSSLREQLDGMSKKNQELSAVYEDLVNDFGGELGNGNAALVVYPDRTVLAVGDTLSFDTGSAALDASDATQLDRLAALIKAHPDRHFQVEGHTDSRPIENATFASNWELGAARAVKTVHALIDRGVNPAQLSAATFAERAPLANEQATGGMAANRRITVAVQTSVSETGAQQALVAAAEKAGGVRYAYMPSDVQPIASAAEPR